MVEIERIKVLLDGSNGEKFMRRVLTPAELELPGRSARTAEFLAGRFAAKEAVSKAFGCGIGQVLGFVDMEILPDVAGKPSVSVSPVAWTRLRLNGPKEYSIHLSITHERHLASAFAVVEELK